MKQIHATAEFGQAAHGVRWAMSQIPDIITTGSTTRVGDRTLVLSKPEKPVGDGFKIQYSDNTITLIAETPTGTIGGLLALADQRSRGEKTNLSQQLRFRTRLYKHEICCEGERRRAGLPPITEYSPRFIEAFFQELARRHFNAVVFYDGYHPFENFLDYEGYPQGTDKPAALRQRNFDALTRLYDTAKKYGLKTYLHHYVSHFTQSIANHHQLGLNEGGSRLANFDHPGIDEYCRYVYQRTFETIPSLDGLLLNFESCGNSITLLKKTLFAVTDKMEKKPALIFRLWGLSDVEGMAKLIKAYPGPKGLKHKGHETNDLYYYPVADDRVKVWKKALPDVEFFFSNGPCHNCGTNICQKLWTDPEYTHALLKSFQDKGADSMSFQSLFELLIPHLPDTEIFTEFEHAFANMNQGHLQSVLDYVRGQAPTRKIWINRVEGYLNTSNKGASAAFTALLESSRIILKQYRQFCYGSAQEGYLYPGRFSHYQEPFFYYPMSFLNRIGEIPHNVAWRAWAVRKEKIKVVPNDTQAIIDYVNPAIKNKPANHPEALARQIDRHIAEARKALDAYQKEAGAKTDKAFVDQVLLNCANGERIRREIRIAIELYSCYFARSKSAFFGHLKKARTLMLETAQVLGDNLKKTDAFCLTTSSGPFTPAQDAIELEKIIALEQEAIPFEALKAYMRSHERYNEIRRLCRPYVSVREEMQKRNRRLLKEALQAAETSGALLLEDKFALYRDNVMAWAGYLHAELDWLTPPAMVCVPDNTIAPNDGFRGLVHDQCYRWGERCWEDFLSFYRRQNFFREDVCDCRATYTDTGLKVSLREHGIVWTEREATWEKNRGTVNQTGFMQLFLETDNTGQRMDHYTFYFKGDGATKASATEFPNGHIQSDKPAVMTNYTAEFRHTDSNWRFDVVIPWEHLGMKPKSGDIWRFNVFSNPSVKRNHRVIWCQAYECQNEVHRLGRIVFK